jgi:abortive infection bacteriophage resistance protein
LQLGLGIFEISFRTNFAYQISLKDNFGITYLEEQSYNNEILSKDENSGDLLKSINQEIVSSKEKFIKRFAEKNEKVPIWAAIEVISFGSISKMYSRWKDDDVKKEVSKRFKSLKNYKHTVGIIRSLVNLRNLCAHQARIWNRELTAPILNRNYLQKFGSSVERSQWRIISILMLLVDEINQNEEYSKKILDLVQKDNDFFQGLIAPTL